MANVDHSNAREAITRPPLPPTGPIPPQASLPMPHRADPRLEAFFGAHEAIDVVPGDRLSTVLLDFREKRIPSFEPKGKVVKSSEEAAELFAVLRSPFVERLSWALVHDTTGEVLAGDIFSVGDVSSCETPRSASGFRDIGMAFDQYSHLPCRLWACHNHPSGSCEPSDADAVVYGQLARKAEMHQVAFTGLVLNGTEFTTMKWCGGGRGTWFDERLPYQTTSPWMAVDGSKPLIAGSTQEVANIGRLLRHAPSTTITLLLTPTLKVKCVSAFAGMPSPNVLAMEMSRCASDHYIIIGDEATGIGTAPVECYPNGGFDFVVRKPDGSIYSRRGSTYNFPVGRTRNPTWG